MVEPVSLIECMLNCGIPMSTVLMPSLVDKMGPMVDPHATSFFTKKSYMSEKSSSGQLVASDWSV